MLDFYRKYIAEGKTIALFAIVFTVLLKVFSLCHQLLPIETFRMPLNGFLWEKTTYLLDSLSCGSSIITYCFTLFFSILVAYISWHFSLIRSKTYLPFALTLVAFNSYPDFCLSTSSFFAAFLFFATIYFLMGTYQQAYPQWKLFQAGILIGITSLFFIGILPYFIFMLVGLVSFRTLNLKNVLALLLGLIFVYWITLIVSFPLGAAGNFLQSFNKLADITFLPFLTFDLSEWIVVGTYIGLFITTLVAHKLSQFKTLLQMDYLFFVSFLSFLTFVFFSWDLLFSQFIMMATFMIPLSHFFALHFSKTKAIFFYILMFLYIFVLVGQIYFL